MLVRGWWLFEVPLQGMLPWSRVAGSPFPPAHRGHPILPLLVSFSSLRRSSLRVVATMAAVSGRDGPGEDSVPRVIERCHRNWT